MLSDASNEEFAGVDDGAGVLGPPPPMAPSVWEAAVGRLDTMAPDYSLLPDDAPDGLDDRDVGDNHVDVVDEFGESGDAGGHPFSFDDDAMHIDSVWNPPDAHHAETSDDHG